MATFSEKTKLLRGYLQGDVAYTGPFFVNVDITCRCNLRCVGCRFHSPLLNEGKETEQTGIHDMPVSFFQRVCEELRTMGTRSITITGEGEPFLHPSLSEIISEAKREGFQVTLVTNGTLLDKPIIEHVMNARVELLKVSLLAATPTEYEKNYPGTDPIFLERVIKGLKILADLKAEQKMALPVVVVHHPINRSNVHSIDSMVDLAQATGANVLSLSPWKTFRGTFDFLSLTEDDEKTLRNSLSRIRKRVNSLSIRDNTRELIRRYDMGDAVWKKLPCYIAWSHARILVDGTVLACHRSNLPMGSLHENSLQEIWNGSAYRAFRRKATRLRGLASLREDCDCNFCGFMIHNANIHRVFRWFSPFLPKSRY